MLKLQELHTRSGKPQRKICFETMIALTDRFFKRKRNQDRVNLLSVGKEQRTSEIMISSEMTTSF